VASVVQTGCTITGAITAPVSAQVLIDFNTAYNQYASVPCTGTLNTAYTGAALTLTPGVYCSAAAVTLTDSTLTLDALGNSNAVWIFKVGTGGTGALTGTNFSVIMANGAQSCNVSWWAAQAATLTTSSFQGTILAGAAITMTGLAGTTTPFNGNALASAAVTLTNFNVNSCQTAGNGGNGGNGDNGDNGGNGGNSHNNCKRHESSDRDSSHRGSSHHGSSHHESSSQNSSDRDSSNHESKDCDSDHNEAGSPYNPFNLIADSERSTDDHGHGVRNH
jgi:hypothetical protein